VEVDGHDQNDRHPAYHQEKDAPLETKTDAHRPSTPLRPHAWDVRLLVRGGATRASTVLARRAREIAVLDTGMGHHDALLVSALKEHGVNPEEVTLVFNTHAHVDHSHNNVLFPNASIYCSSRDREWTMAVHDALARAETPGPEHITAFYPEMAAAVGEKIVRKILGIEKMLWDPRRLGEDSRTVPLETNEPPAGITVIPTPGHSPHHLSFAIETSDIPVVVCGDALLLRGEETYEAVMMPSWNSREYAASRARLLERTALIVPGHDEPFQHDLPGPR
jgi:N-acyl homoserine lactone hydrolase